ncbi:autotransporter outer membrane beta-barrel domain-containing protein [Plakobranchus ocellatus]|uniref:Autotransporter outer membrane beta-barrel domain-containing protein n=1 Tax=Plakobranchus ocellatus TaxID=259542 RepID=A0AAV4AD10_9GAST|nr:autotransporter outer membrane beta-barrel domain-containing protein [Plakobranchus ocellatus]
MAAAPAEHAIVLGATFPDYLSFEKAFHEYCEKTGYVFSKDGKTVESANRKIRNPALHFKPEFRYQVITFQCKHFGDYASKGKGIRKFQISNKIGCKASLRLSADRQKNCLEIRHFEDEHSHPFVTEFGEPFFFTLCLVGLYNCVPVSRSCKGWQL